MASSWKPSADTAGALLSRQHTEIFLYEVGSSIYGNRMQRPSAPDGPMRTRGCGLFLRACAQLHVPGAASSGTLLVLGRNTAHGWGLSEPGSRRRLLRSDSWHLTPLRASLWMWSTAPTLSLCGDETTDVSPVLGPLRAWQELDQWQLRFSHFISCKRLQLYGQERPFLASLTKTLKTVSQDEISVLQFNQGSELSLEATSPEQVVVPDVCSSHLCALTCPLCNYTGIHFSSQAPGEPTSEQAAG